MLTNRIAKLHLATAASGIAYGIFGAYIMHNQCERSREKYLEITRSLEVITAKEQSKSDYMIDIAKLQEKTDDSLLHSYKTCEKSLDQELTSIVIQSKWFNENDIKDKLNHITEQTNECVSNSYNCGKNQVGMVCLWIMLVASAVVGYPGAKALYQQRKKQ